MTDMQDKVYRINRGIRDQAIRMGCEIGLKEFIHDYALEMGMSDSATLRRLALIGARCEKEHGRARMPSSYQNLELPNIDKIMAEIEDEDNGNSALRV